MCLMCFDGVHHNPVIGISRIDTLHNVVDILSLVQTLILIPHDQGNGVDFDEQASMGLSCILSCAIDALQFEINHRNREV